MPEGAVDHPDSLEARKERFLRKVRMMEVQARAQLRLVGPAVPTQDDGMGFRKCLRCSPPPELFKCPVCDTEFEQKWRFKLHLDSNPKWCVDQGKRKARAWSRKV